MKSKESVDKLRDQLPLKDLKLTRPRRVIAEKMLSAKVGQHFSADELWESLREKHKDVSRATVYRTLSLLVEKKLVEEHDFGKGQKYYERLVERPHHDHLVCISCGRIIEFENPDIEKLQEEVARQQGFEISYHSHKLFGSCSRCRTAKKQHTA
jgi:Fur family ferric uptake transcriptional regulator